MKKFFKQQGAFDALKVGQCVFQNQTGGTRYYVACTNEEYWKKYLEKGDRFGYELIMKGTPSGEELFQLGHCRSEHSDAVHVLLIGI